MPRPQHSSWWRRLYVPLAALPLLLAACARQTSEPPSSSRTATTGSPTVASRAEPAAVAWVGRLCETVGGLVQAVQDATPDTGAATTPDDLKRAWSNQLGVAGASLAAAAQQLGQLGPSPVTAGDQTARDLAAKYTRLIDPINRAKTAMDALPAGSSEQDVGRVMGTNLATLSALGTHPFDDVTHSSDLTTAGNQSSTCRTQWWWTLVDR